MEKAQLYELIEQYLEGNLSGEELEQFELRLQTEPELKEEVELHRKLQNELGDTQKRLLRSRLDVLRKEFTDSEEETKVIPIQRKSNLRVIISIAAGILILVFTFWLFFFKTPEKQEIVKDDETPIEKTDPKDQLEDPIKEIEDPSNLVEDNTAPQNESENELENDTPIPSPNQLASFDPNPELENLIAQNDSQTNFEFSVEKPTGKGVFLLKDGKIDLEINGILMASAIEDLNSLEATLFDNNPQNYASGKSKATIPLLLEKVEEESEDEFAFGEKEAYYFKLEKRLTTTPGLYYYLIFEKGKSEPLYTGKFEAKE